MLASLATSLLRLRKLRAAVCVGAAAATLTAGMAGTPVAAASAPVAGAVAQVGGHIGQVSAAHPLRLPDVVNTKPELVQTIAGVGRRGRTTARPAAGTPRLETTSNTSPLLLQSWPGSSRSTQVSAFGNDQKLTPPDPQIAVGPSWVIETTNTSLLVFQRTGTPFPDAPGATCPPPGPGSSGYAFASLKGCDEVDLNNFINKPAGWELSDPRLLYDPSVGRFYLSFFLTVTPGPTVSCFLGSPNGDTCSVVFVLHTNSGDPTGQWSGYYFASYYLDAITDEPMIGFSSDKLAVSWDEFDAGTSPPGWLGDEYAVLSKSTFLANGADPIIFPRNGQLLAPSQEPGGAFFSIFPVSNPLGGSTLFLISNGAAQDLTPGSSPYILVMSVTGTTSANVAVSGEHAAVSSYSTSSAPAALQAGSTDTIDPDDDRINNGVFAKGVIWTGFDEACTPQGDTKDRACVRYLAISTATNPPSVLHEIHYGTPNAYVYYPSFGIDPAGDLISTFTTSSSSTDPGVMAVGIPAGQSQMSAPVPVVSGKGPYVASESGACSPSNDPLNGTTACRYGDYAGAAMDPSHPHDIWFANEAQLDAGNQDDWGTEVGRVTYAAPSIANLTPSVGPTAGGTTVVVNGSDFGPGSQFSFAGTSPSPTVLTPDSFTFTTPAEPAGSVTGTVTDGNGTSAPSPYLYVPPSTYVPLTPYRVLDTRSSSCIQCSGGALGPGATRTIQVGGYTPSGYTGTVVPASATAVVLNVTAVQGTQPTFVTAFPAGGGAPTASNLNASKGEVIPNLVTVALGNNGDVSIFNAAGSINVVADVQGYYTSSTGAAGSPGEYHALSPPVRTCDTRSGNGTPCAGHPIGAGQRLLVAVTGGQSAVSDGGAAAAVALNLTAVQGTKATYLTVFPPSLSGGSPTCTSPPLVSDLNVGPNAIQPNRVIATVVQSQGAGYVCVFNAAGTINVLLDVDGWFGNGSDTGGALFYALGPTRICDTRYTQGTECAGNTIGPGVSLPVQVAGVGPLPSSGIAAMVANVTAVQGTSGTYLSVYPDASSRPATSDLNAAPKEIIPNLVMVGVASDGKVDIYNAAGSINVIVDVAGWFALPPA